jgi:hypothetical protein
VDRLALHPTGLQRRLYAGDCQDGGRVRRSIVVRTLVTEEGKDSRKWRQARKELVFEQGVVRSPLNNRAWVFQEKPLSRRIIHFGSGVLDARILSAMSHTQNKNDFPKLKIQTGRAQKIGG